MKKPGRTTYLNEEEDSLVVATDKVEVVHGLTFDCHGVTMQLQNVVKDFNSQCGDYSILHKSSVRYLWEVIKRANKKVDEHEYQKIRTHTGLVKVLSFSNTQASQSYTS